MLGVTAILSGADTLNSPEIVVKKREKSKIVGF
jgi:hypothetical protein